MDRCSRRGPASWRHHDTAFLAALGRRSNVHHPNASVAAGTGIAPVDGGVASGSTLLKIALQGAVDLGSGNLNSAALVTSTFAILAWWSKSTAGPFH